MGDVSFLVRSGEFSEGMIENDSRGGLSYGSYLKLLLLTEDTETKLLRMMDLIQINMKGSERGFCPFQFILRFHRQSAA